MKNFQVRQKLKIFRLKFEKWKK